MVLEIRNEITVNHIFWVVGGGMNYQMQIVTKLPDENIQTCQQQMINSGGGTTKCKLSPNYQMENNQTYQPQMSGSGGGGKLPIVICAIIN